MAGENESLAKKLDYLKIEANNHQDRHDELKNSTVTLTQALVRLEDDNTARALVENTQQSEVLRLKNALEKANTAVDRLKHLSVDLEEQMQSLVSPEVMAEKESQVVVLRKELGIMRSNHRLLATKFYTLKDSMNRVSDKEGGGEGEEEGKGEGGEEGGGGGGEGRGKVAARTQRGPVSSALVDDLIEQIEKLKATMEEGKARKTDVNEDAHIENESFQPDGNYFNSRGAGEDVPEYLRYEGPLRNWRLSKRECERCVNDVWMAKEEWVEDNEGESIHLSDFMYIYLVEKFESNQALIAEFGYNMIDALERYISDSDCKIFLKILQGELAEEVRDAELGMLVEIPRVMEDEDMAIHSGNPSGLLPLPIYMRRLRRLLTTKSEHSFNKLQKALAFEVKKGRNVAYNELFEEDEDGNQGDFCELLRAQHLEEIIAYDKALVDAIGEKEAKEGTRGWLKLSALRDVIGHVDVDKPRAEINIYLARGYGLGIQECMDKEAEGESVVVAEFVTRLRDGLLKRSEKIGAVSG